MEIIRHKSISLTAEEILAMALRKKKIPEGVTIGLTNDVIVAEPEDCCNLFGDLTEDYEMIYYEEEE